MFCCRTRSALIALSLACISQVMPAFAHTYCVATAVDLQAALDAASASSASDAIHLVAGTYTPILANGFFADLQATGDLEISGGWYSGCLARVKGQRSTIDGQDVVPGLVILGSNHSGGQLTISHLNFIHGYSDESLLGGGLTANPYASSNLDITIDANRFADNNAEETTAGAGGGLRTVADGNLVVSNNIFVRNHATYNGGAALLHCENVLAKIVNNTVTDNKAFAGNGAGDRAGLEIGGGCFTEVSNNILWGNTGLDLILFTQGVRLYNNDLADLGGDQPPGSSADNVYVNPQFVSAADQRLRRVSPLIDAGFDTPIDGLPALAFDDGPRLAGPHVDIGAYELDRLFEDGFDPSFGPALAD